MFHKPCELCGGTISTKYKSTLAIKRFCSRSCRSKSLWTTTGPAMKVGQVEYIDSKCFIRHEMTCLHCGEKFFVRPSRLNTAKYCSYRCCGHPNFDKEPTKHKASYRNKIKKYDHIWIAEELIGRALHEIETVHHIDGKIGDNSPINLIILTRSQHTTIHMIQRHHKCHFSAQDIMDKYPDAIWLEDYAATAPPVENVGKPF